MFLQTLDVRFLLVPLKQHLPRHATVNFAYFYLMVTRPALCIAGSTFWNKILKSQLPINRISLSFFCVASTGITESNRMLQVLPVEPMYQNLIL